MAIRWVKCSHWKGGEGGRRALTKKKNVSVPTLGKPNSLM